ncbi:hypothetical protein [Sodalis ligni]|uniref:hypothetical protein n=1 Tax=Sodalis ligni TaxID=2697027 RepID=UPI0020975552|nr:hypothetical protein [Sodalis ligni]
MNRHQGDFGHKYIMLPNPSYGDWENGLSKTYSKASNQDKLNMREQMINAWDGK